MLSTHSSGLIELNTATFLNNSKFDNKKNLIITKLLFKFAKPNYNEDTDDKNNTALIAAVKKNNKELVRFLLDHGSSPNTKNSELQTALHFCALQICSAANMVKKLDNKDILEILKLLLNAGANPNIRNSFGNTPLLNLIDLKSFYKTGYDTELLLKAVDLLLERGANINEKNSQEQNIFFKAIESIDKTENFNKTIDQSCMKLLEGLISKGSDLNSKTKAGNTPLFVSANSGYEKLKTIKLLADNGADLNLKYKNNQTVLMLLVSNGRLRMVKFLLENYKIDLDAKNDFGKTALSFACSSNNFEIVKILIDQGANEIFPDGNTLMHCFDLNRSTIEFIEYLIDERKININSQNNFGETPLILAVKKWTHGKIEIIKQLIYYGANIKLVDNHGKTAYDYAKLKKDQNKKLKYLPELLEILKVKGKKKKQ